MNVPPRFDELCGLVQADQERRVGQSRATYIQRRARFVDAVINESPRRPSPWRWTIGWAVLAMSAALVLLWALPIGGDSDEVLEFTVASASGTPGDWLSAGQEPIEIAFSDGTELLVNAGGKARVDPTSRGARVVLEEGAVHLDVESREQADWRVDAGPFAVRVTGTEFDVNWQPVSGEIRVAVQEGTVAVEGPIWAAVQHISAGNAIEARLPKSEVTRLETTEATETTETTDGAGVSDESEVARPKRRAKRAQPASPWQAMAARGDHREAIAAAEVEGFGGLCDRLPAGALLKLGESARYARKPARANEALTAVRRRFPDSKAAATAAYNLGLVAFDQRRAYGTAASWFGKYLREQPRGALAREALGRQMESYKRGGDRAKARAVAQTYSQRYPAGPHADLANKLQLP